MAAQVSRLCQYFVVIVESATGIRKLHADTAQLCMPAPYRAATACQIAGQAGQTAPSQQGVQIVMLAPGGGIGEVTGIRLGCQGAL